MAGRASRAASEVTKFCEAVWKRQPRTIQELLDRIDPNGKDRWNRRPLLMAAQYGECSLVKQLLERGAEVNAGRSQLTPIALAAANDRHEVVEVLRQAGAELTTVACVYLGERRAVALAPIVIDEEGTPLFHHAAQALNAELVMDLLARDEDVDVIDSRRETALHRLADLRRTTGAKAATIAQLLLDRGANVNARNHAGVTPLHLAIRARNLPVAQVLLQHGADPNAVDQRGSTPLRRAMSSSGAGGTAGIDATPFVTLLLTWGATPPRP